MKGRSRRAEPARSCGGVKVRWILDDGPFGHLASIQPRKKELWEPGVLLVAGSTADAASTLSQKLFEGARVGRFDVKIGAEDPAEEVFAELHPDPSSTSNRAEHESIAWALVHGANAVYVFVGYDKKAAMIALAHLGRARVAHPYDLWMDLFERGWIDSRELDDLCTLTGNSDKSLPRPRRVREFLAKVNPETR